VSFFFIFNLYLYLVMKQKKVMNGEEKQMKNWALREEKGSKQPKRNLRKGPTEEVQ
jgi:hypothetical protein